MTQYTGKLLSADDSPIQVHGRTTLTVTVGNKTVQHSVLVADITNEGLIGLDFLTTHKLVLDFSTNKIFCNGEELVACCRVGTDRACRVSLVEPTIIPAGTRTIVQGKTNQPLIPGSWMIEPLKQPTRERTVLTAKALVTGTGSRIPVEILNPTDDNVYLSCHPNSRA